MCAVRSLFPVDVVRLILEAAYLNPDQTLWDEYGRRNRTAWFASTLSVARSWYSSGQRALYHRIEVATQDERTVDLLFRTLCRKPHVAQMVKILHIQSNIRPSRPLSTRSAFQFTSPGIPIVTKKGRAAWRRKRQYGKMARILGICTDLNVLRVEQPDLDVLRCATEILSRSLERVEIHRAHEVRRDQWQHLAQSKFWRNLRCIHFDATSPAWRLPLHGTIFSLDSAFIGVETTWRLEHLAIGAFATTNDIHAILHVVGPTIKTLHCAQTERASSTWLPLVSAKLQTLVLSIWSHWHLADLSMLNQLDHLTIMVLTAYKQRPGDVPRFPLPCLPQSISTFELRVSDRLDPWCAAAHVADITRAFNLKAVPRLTLIVVTVLLRELQQLNEWLPVAFLASDVVKRRGLEFRVDIRFELHRPDLLQVDLFSRLRHQREKEKQEEQRKSTQRNCLLRVASTLSTILCKGSASARA